MNAYIVKGYRTAVAKAKKGKFRFYRPDDLAAGVIKHLMAQVPALETAHIDDLICGCAIPEAEQGMQMGRMISLLAFDTIDVPGMIVNRYCGSGLEAIALAAAKINAGMANCIIAGGTESMSMVPMLGYKTALNYKLAQVHPEYYLSMGLTAEELAAEYGITREMSDNFSIKSHEKALAAIAEGKFKDEIVPVEVTETFVNPQGRKENRKYIVDTDEGPRKSTPEGLAKLRPAFKKGGQVTAGNSSQTSDGAAFVLVMSEQMVKSLNLTPVARLLSYATAGVNPRIMGIGPKEAVPKALKQANLKLQDIAQIELNEAFSAQSLAVIKALDLDPDCVNVNGGAIALGHPLGCTGAKLSVQLFNEMRRRKQKYGMVTACVGGGQGVAGIYELLA